MRLRLSVQRHRLPPTNILWSVPDHVSPQAYTIARLLEDVNTTIPLEAEHWGLEDYAVEVGGFECLHFSPVSQTLKDDDEVTIRPLLTAEVRSRTLCGRYQISDGGQHLVDGVPFGRPLLRPQIRPHVRIPPRKRQRLLEDTVDRGESEVVTGLITANGEMSPDIGRVNLANSDGKSSRRRKQNGRSVHFGQLPVEEADSDEDEDEDFVPEEASDISMLDDSKDETDDSSDVSDSSSSDSDSDDTSSSDSDSDSDSDRSSDSDSDSDDDSTGTSDYGEAKSGEPHVPPGKGSKATKNRNKRRTEAKKLKRWKASGVLPATATMEDLRKRVGPQAEEPQTRDNDLTEILPTPLTGETMRKRKREIPEDTTTRTPIDMDQSTTDKNAGDGTEAERQKHELGGQMTEDPSSAEKIEQPNPESGRKRMRPNVSAISRILSHQARQLDRTSPKSKKASQVEEPQAPLDPDFWKSRINLSAFECWEEEYILSAPPFPFKQHWDPASQLMREKGKRKQKTKGGRTSSQGTAAIPDDEDTVQLDYGDPPERNENLDAFQTDGDPTAAIESQLLQDVATAARIDLPPLPENVNALPTLSQSDIKQGAVIVFKLFIINPVNMNPEISGFKTAIVEEEGDSGNGAGVIGLKLAERDVVRKVKKFDKHGNRIYDSVDKFQMGDSDDEDEDGLLYHHFGELLEAKLLKAA